MTKKRIKQTGSNKRVCRRYGKREKGSVLVLTLIAVLILSVTVTGLLLVGRTELFSTQSNYLDKAAYYTAVWGVEEIREAIMEGQFTTVAAMTKTYPETQFVQDSINRLYIIGNMKDMEDTVKAIESGGAVPMKTLEKFEGFNVQMPGGSVAIGQPTQTAVWKVCVTGKASGVSRHAFAEVVCGVVSVLKSTSD
jgi:hypothetical protein